MALLRLLDQPLATVALLWVSLASCIPPQWQLLAAFEFIQQADPATFVLGLSRGRTIEAANCALDKSQAHEQPHRLVSTLSHRSDVACKRATLGCADKLNVSTFQQASSAIVHDVGAAVGRGQDGGCRAEAHRE